MCVCVLARALLPTSPTILWHLSPLPGNELHEVVIEGNSSLSIKDGRMGIAVKIRGDHLRDNFKDTCSLTRISRNPDFDSQTVLSVTHLVYRTETFCVGDRI